MILLGGGALFVGCDLEYTLMHKGFCNKTTTHSHMQRSHIASSIHFACPIFFWWNLCLPYIYNINRVHNNKAFIHKITPICLSQNHWTHHPMYAQHSVGLNLHFLGLTQCPSYTYNPYFDKHPSPCAQWMGDIQIIPLLCTHMRTYGIAKCIPRVILQMLE